MNPAPDCSIDFFSVHTLSGRVLPKEGRESGGGGSRSKYTQVPSPKSRVYLAAGPDGQFDFCGQRACLSHGGPLKGCFGVPGAPLLAAKGHIVTKKGWVRAVSNILNVTVRSHFGSSMLWAPC
jgi:hypothetical protein